jgi:hypothetical protein
MALGELEGRDDTELSESSKLKGLQLPGASVVLDRRGERFAERTSGGVWVVLADIPEQVQKVPAYTVLTPILIRCHGTFPSAKGAK